MARFPLNICQGGNATVANRLRANTVKYAFAPRLAWSLPITFRHLQLLPSTQTIVLDFTYDVAGVDEIELTFSGGGLAAPVVLTLDTSGATSDEDVAAIVEAAIEAARGVGEDLEGVVTGETVAATAVTVVALTKAAGVEPLSIVLEPVVDDVVTMTATYTYATTIVPTTDLGLGGPYEFFDGVIRGSSTVTRKTAFAGVDAITAIMGDAADDNGLLTSTDLATTGIVQTTGAAEFQPRREVTFTPQIIISIVSNEASGNGALTAGEAIFEIQCHPVPEAQ